MQDTDAELAVDGYLLIAFTYSLKYVHRQRVKSVLVFWRSFSNQLTAAAYPVVISYKM